MDWLCALSIALVVALQLAGALQLVGAVLPGSSSAEAEAGSEAGAAPDVEWAYALAHELMSPFCPGRTLAECSSPQAAELRLWILTQAAAGATPEEVKANLFGRFGDVLRSTPRAEGWGLWAYLVPIFFFVIGGPGVVWIIRRLAGGPGGGEGPSAGSGGSGAAPLAAASAAGSDAELELRIDQELGGG